MGSDSNCRIDNSSLTPINANSSLTPISVALPCVTARPGASSCGLNGMDPVEPVAPKRQNALLLFLLTTALGGIGGAGGSIIGNAGDRIGLFAGGLAGGVLGAILGTRIAVARSWLPRARLRGAATGAAIGFLLAASIAVNTLSTPVGPVLSTLLIGVGALAGAAYGDAGQGA